MTCLAKCGPAVATTLRRVVAVFTANVEEFVDRLKFDATTFVAFTVFMNASIFKLTKINPLHFLIKYSNVKIKIRLYSSIQ